MKATIKAELLKVIEESDFVEYKTKSFISKEIRDLEFKLGNGYFIDLVENKTKFRIDYTQPMIFYKKFNDVFKPIATYNGKKFERVDL